MTTWNTGPGYGYPPQDPNAGYYGQPGYPPPQQPYPGAAYGGGGGGGAYPGAAYPANPPQPGFVQPPPYGGMPPPAAAPQGDFNNTQGTSVYDLEAYVPADSESGEKGFGFDDRSIRHGFIRKVYGILMVQLSVTVAFMAFFIYHIPTRSFLEVNGILVLVIASIFSIVIVIVLACCGEIRRKAPYNFIFLGLITLCQILMMGAVISHVDADIVLMAVAITAGVCLVLTLFAFQTRYDFTMCGGILFVSLMIVIVLGFVLIFFPGKTGSIIYGSLGALLFSVYLIYDTQLMMGGNHKCSISPEEYIFAALNLYLDIINLFLYILTILSASKK